MTWRSAEWVEPLDQAENHLLQVLLDDFRLTRNGLRTFLSVRFDGETPAIRHRRSKSTLAHTIDEAARRDCQEKLDAMLLGGAMKPYQHAEHYDDFPFRYANGGTLPIVNLDGDDYYCFFYRDVFPVGWNIANGGSDSRDELVDPDPIIERELREELMVFDFHGRRRFVFQWDDAEPFDRAEFIAARKFWMDFFPGCDLNEFETSFLPLIWMPAPDSITVNGGAPCDDILLNINALDLSIEIDRVATLKLPPGAAICDGEIVSGQLLNRPVGLFPIADVRQALADDSVAFRPKIVFWNGLRRDDYPDIDEIIRGDRSFLPNLVERGIRTEEEARTCADDPRFLGLCPVTERVVRRHLDYYEHEYPVRPVSPNSPEYFVSFASEDRKWARHVYDRIRKADSRERGVFFSEELRDPSFIPAINQAIESAAKMIVVATDPRHVTKNWVQYEWESFFNEIMGGRKHARAVLVPFISGFHHHELPLTLRSKSAVKFEPDNPESGLGQLMGCLGLE